MKNIETDHKKIWMSLGLTVLLGNPAFAAERQELAIRVRDNSRIALYTSHTSGISDPASTARQNIVDAANCQPSKTSGYSDVGVTSVWLHTGMLDAMGRLVSSYGYSYGVTEIAGGDHSSTSRHYSGLAFDIYQINGVGVTSSNPYVSAFKQRCRDMGATEVLGPGDVGHDTHVHAGWPRGTTGSNPGSCLPPPLPPPPPPPWRVDTFVKGTDGQVWQKYSDGGAWSAWLPLGGATLTSDVGACSWGNNRIDLFYRGTDNACWHSFFDGSWHMNWDSLGGTLIGKPAAASWGVNRIDLFVRGTDDRLYSKTFNGAWQTGFGSPIAGTIASDPAAVSWGPDRIDVFAKDANNQIIHAWYDGVSWNGWETFTGGYSAGTPTATSRGSGRLDLFIRGTDNALYHKWYDAGVGWQPGGLAGAWENQGGSLFSDPGSCADSSSRVHAFVQGADNAMWHRWYDSGVWGGFESLGGTLTGAPAACSWTRP
ncbi:MAG: hypothetical protein ACR2H1_11500 [Limisphaerales bacterium]